jgi:hypothetical protein
VVSWERNKNNWQMYPWAVSRRCGLYAHEGCVLYRQARSNAFGIKRATVSKVGLSQHYDTIGDVPLLVAHIILVALSEAVNSMQILAYLYIHLYI